MDSIDALLAQTPRSGSIAGIAVGSVPVWNGTTWVKPSGTPDGTKFLRDDGSWGGAFATYVPAWGSTGAAPALNNGTIAGRYIQVGKLVFFKIILTIGSTSTFGTAAWKFTLPVAAAAAVASQNVLVRSVDVSTSAVYHQGANVESVSGAIPSTFASPVTYYDGAVPFAWATGDTLEISGTYEAA